ncbi:hypothetical protein BGP77_03000 [Saccharospirillum sp. MSK14-1]|nr:hypothetical protein BGP77_03000 [Saccharospirillum sp. MSK14-1]
MNLIWRASNGSVSTRFEYYANAGSLKEIAERLESFPQNSRDVYLYELGSEKPEDKFAYYFRLRAFTTNLLGKTALQVRFNNNEDLPNREVVEFCIQAEPSAINRLGELFRKFANLNQEYLAWSDSESFIGDKSEYEQ